MNAYTGIYIYLFIYIIEYPDIHTLYINTYIVKSLFLVSIEENK